jgi:hypothetical protein
MNPGNVIFLFSFFLCCYSDTLEYGHHLEAVQDAYRLHLKLFLSEVANGSFSLAFEASWSFMLTISIAKLASFMDVEKVILTLLYSFINVKRELHLE